MRRIVIPIGKEGKNAKIRQIHSSQIFYICPTECFDPNTPILTWDGQVKLAKDIIIGDILIDDKGNPTKVRKTISGVAPMYEVKTNKNNFLNYTVTSNHILTLKIIDSEIVESELNKLGIAIDDDKVIDITISEYEKLSDKIKEYLFIFKCQNISKWTDKIEKDIQTRFQLTEKPNGDFVGFQLENDGRFLLSDFSVSHKMLCKKGF
jgi:hypothetical protein